MLLSVVLISHCASLRKHLLMALCLIFVRTGTLAGSPCNPQMEFPLRGRRTFYTWQPTTQGYSATLTFREKRSTRLTGLCHNPLFMKNPPSPPSRFITMRRIQIKKPECKVRPRVHICLLCVCAQMGKFPNYFLFFLFFCTTSNPSSLYLYKVCSVQDIMWKFGLEDFLHILR